MQQAEMHTRATGRPGGRSTGFTVIEVLIVLAIAGLFILIVFLAVPALQRNQRNTVAKNDAKNVLGGVSEYFGANNGKLPTTVSGTGKIVYGAGIPTEVAVNGTTSVEPTTTVPAVGEGAGELHPGLMKVYFQVACDGNGAVTPNVRSAAVFYVIEVMNGDPVRQCISY